MIGEMDDEDDSESGPMVPSSPTRDHRREDRFEDDPPSMSDRLVPPLSEGKATEGPRKRSKSDSDIHLSIDLGTDEISPSTPIKQLDRMRFNWRRCMRRSEWRKVSSECKILIAIVMTAVTTLTIVLLLLNIDRQWIR